MLLLCRIWRDITRGIGKREEDIGGRDGEGRLAWVHLQSHSFYSAEIGPCVSAPYDGGSSTIRSASNGSSRSNDIARAVFGVGL